MTLLLANGCSHTSGSYIESTHLPCYNQAWPKWLADDMGWDWVNLAEAANSNEQIKRTTIEWIIENVEITNKYKASELVVMIMWSGFDRFEIWNDNLHKLTSGNAISDFRNCSYEVTEYIKYRTITSKTEVIEYRNLMDVYLTAKYLEGLKIKYYFINSLNCWRDPDSYSKLTRSNNLIKNYKLLYDAYGHRRNRHLAFSLLEERFRQYMREQKIPFSVYDPVKLHFGVEGHKVWKEYVKQWMTRIDNV